MTRSQMTAAEREADDQASIARAKDFSPFIYGGLAVAAFGGFVGIDRKKRGLALGVAALLFIAI